MSYKLGIIEREKLIAATQADGVLWQLSARHVLFDKTSEKLFSLFEDGLTDGQLLEYIMYRHYKSIFQNSFQPATDKLDLLKKISANKRQFLNQDFNLLEEGAANQSFVFNRQTAREELLLKVCKFINIDPESHRAIRIVQTTEELVMNAQITAPIVKNSADQSVSTLKIEYADQLLAISVLDDYGSLDCKKFLKKVESALALGLDKSINFGKGGAGIGSSLIFRNCDSLFLGVQANRKTRVSVIMPFNVAEKKFDSLQRSINIIEIK